MRAPLLCVVVLLLPGAAGQPFLQYQGDSARTGAVEGAGPDDLSLAFAIDVPGSPGETSPPLIINGSVYVVTREVNALAADQVSTLTAYLYRVSLEDAQASLMAEIPDSGRPYGLVSDGTLLYLWAAGAIHAFSLDGTEAPWSPVVPDWGPDGMTAKTCRHGAFAEGRMVWTCTLEPIDAVSTRATLLNRFSAEAAGVVAIMDGNVEWVKRLDGAGEDNPGAGDPSDPDARASVAPWVVAGDESGVYVSYTVSWAGYPTLPEVKAFDWNGTPRWRWPTALDQISDAAVGAIDGTDPENTEEYVEGEYPRMALGPEAVYVAGLEFVVLSKDGDVRARTPLMNPTGDEYWDAGQPAISGDQVILPGPGTLSSVRATSFITDWQINLDSNWDRSFGTLLEDEMLFIGDYSGTLTAYDRSDGTAIWASNDPGLGQIEMAMGEGVFVFQRDRTFVYGSTPAAIQLDVRPTTLYPPIGETLRLDLSGTRPGVLAEDTTYRIDWGDGVIDDVDARYAEHAYSAPGTKSVVVTASNTAGQSARAVIEVYPGSRDPADRTFLETAFNQDNQETTFFILGLIATLLFAGFSVLRLRRRRSLLAKELEAVDEEVAALGDDAPAVRETLRQRRNRARRLFLEGRLDEGSTSLLERHIDERLRDHRLGAAERDFAFLPYGLFRTMQEILRDARVNDWELENFKERLDAEPKLTAAQRKKVRQRVQTWHAEDRV